jgi:hypothetical protein
MTEEELIKANELQKEIQKLEWFIRKARKVWTGKIIKRTSKFIFKSDSYGMFEEEEYEMNTEVKNKVLNVLVEHLKDLRKQLESL